MISIRHLRKEYENATPLSDVCAEIEKGEVISVIGPSGTGKSTLLRCLNRLELPTSGEVWVDAENTMAASYDLNKMRRKMGMVFQSFNLFEHKTVIENVMMPMLDLLHMDKQAAYDKAISLLSMVGLESRALQYPSMLSGGQKQRVAITRTLAMDPEIILFDEPTSALDPAMVGEVQSVIQMLKKQGMTMLIVTHDMHFAAEVSTRVFYMDQGIIYEDGTPEQIFEHPEKERTRNFIQQVRTFTKHLTTENFDFLETSTEIASMGQKLWWSERMVKSICLIFEELVQATLVPHMKEQFDADFTLSYAGKSKDITIRLSYPGDAFNVYMDMDELISPLIDSIVLTMNHKYENGINTLDLSVVNLT